MPSKQSGEKPLPLSSEARPVYEEKIDLRLRLVNTGSYVAVYVIGPETGEGPVKVGMARKPNSRLATLQTGVWMRLGLMDVRWVKSQALARKVEQEAHKLLAVAGKALVGEWFDVTHDKASEAIEWAALTVGAELIDDGDMKVVPSEQARSIFNCRDMRFLTEEQQAFMSRARQHWRLKKAGQL